MKKYLGGLAPSSFGRQQQLSEITIEPIKNLAGWARFLGAGQDLGACAPWPQHRTATDCMPPKEICSFDI